LKNIIPCCLFTVSPLTKPCSLSKFCLLRFGSAYSHSSFFIFNRCWFGCHVPKSLTLYFPHVSSSLFFLFCWVVKKGLFNSASASARPLLLFPFCPVNSLNTFPASRYYFPSSLFYSFCHGFLRSLIVPQSFLFCSQTFRFLFPGLLPEMAPSSLSPKFLPLSSVDSSAPDKSVHLRLLHSWRAGTPGSTTFFAFCTLWCDIEGTIIEGTSHKNHADALSASLISRKVYCLRNFSFVQPRSTYRASRSAHSLHLNLTTGFDEVPDDDHVFPFEAFDFVPLSQLSGRIHPRPCSYLTDVVGVVVAIGNPGYISTRNGPARCQKVIIKDESSSVQITLWEPFCDVLDAGDILALDQLSPVVLAIGGLSIVLLRGEPCGSSCSTTRIEVAPRLLRTDELCAIFSKTKGTAVLLESEFTTATEFDAYVQKSFRTISQLDELQQDVVVDNSKYRCSATVTGVSVNQPWWYRGCCQCSRAVVESVDGYNCPSHGALAVDDTKPCFKIHLDVEDPTGATTLLLLGFTAETTLQITAAGLCRSFPDESFGFPPQLQHFFGKTLTFEVQLPQVSYVAKQSSLLITKVFNLPRMSPHKRPLSCTTPTTPQAVLTRPSVFATPSSASSSSPGESSFSPVSSSAHAISLSEVPTPPSIVPAYSIKTSSASQSPDVQVAPAALESTPASVDGSDSDDEKPLAVYARKCRLRTSQSVVRRLDL
ncbi:Replication protein A 70 kDa DNA-binding subunit B, partial [Linum perenne]